jgi:head-tail adaptor
MSDVLETVNSAESKAKSFADLAKPFADADLVAIDPSKSEAAATAEGEAVKAIQDARKAVAAKRATKDADVTKALQELQVKINSANQVVTAGKKDIAAGTQLVKGKDLLEAQGSKVSALEASLDNVENKSEMREELDDEAVQALIQDTDKAQLDAKACMATLQKEIAGTAAALKGDMQKLIERCKGVNARVDKVRTAMKDQRERVLGGMFV